MNLDRYYDAVFCLEHSSFWAKVLASLSRKGYSLVISPAEVPQPKLAPESPVVSTGQMGDHHLHFKEEMETRDRELKASANKENAHAQKHSMHREPQMDLWAKNSTLDNDIPKSKVLDQHYADQILPLLTARADSNGLAENYAIKGLISSCWDCDWIEYPSHNNYLSYHSGGRCRDVGPVFRIQLKSDALQESRVQHVCLVVNNDSLNPLLRSEEALHKLAQIRVEHLLLQSKKYGWITVNTSQCTRKELKL
jgi:hypothetical protein